MTCLEFLTFPHFFDFCYFFDEYLIPFFLYFLVIFFFLEHIYLDNIFIYFLFQSFFSTFESFILGALLFQFLKNLLVYSCKPCLKPIFELHMHLQLLHSTRFLHLTTFGKENLAFHTRENP